MRHVWCWITRTFVITTLYTRRSAHPRQDLMIEDAHFRGLVAKAAAIEAKMGEMEVRW